VTPAHEKRLTARAGQCRTKRLWNRLVMDDER
jgi:hypothetical protein